MKLVFFFFNALTGVYNFMGFHICVLLKMLKGPVLVNSCFLF
jgi:hypothetical protein